jgi:hypothetical protein
MPCDTINRFAVSIEKLDPALAKAAIASLGLPYSVVYQNGQLIVQGSGSIDMIELARKVKVAYSGAVIQATAKRFGWQIKSTGENKFNIQRR